MVYKSRELEKEAILHVAELMMAAARTAPKGHGIDNLETVVLDGEDKNKLTDEMRKIAKETGADFFHRDAGNIDNSPYIFLIGVRHKPSQVINCGFCGYKDCETADKNGASCAFNMTDLGIALGSAVTVASDNKIDNRVMFSAGKAAINLGIFQSEVRACYGVPLSVSGKSIFYDRG